MPKLITAFRTHAAAFCFILLSIISLHAEPSIIYLRGTCSAGKSTLLRKISKQCQNILVVEEDNLVVQMFPLAVSQRYPVEYEYIRQAIAEENIFHALRTKHTLYKPGVTEEERINANNSLEVIKSELNSIENKPWNDDVNDSIRHEIMERIVSALNNQKHVLLDSTYFSAQQIKEFFPDNSVKQVLLYCSFPVAYQRLLKRNNDAVLNNNLLEKRFFNTLIISFNALYELSSHPLQPIQSIDVEGLESIFNNIAPTLPIKPDYEQRLFNYGEISKSQFIELQEKIFSPCKNNKAAPYFITPKLKQDLIIDHTDGDLQKAIEALKKMLIPENS